MPRYFFNVSNKIAMPDTKGLILPDVPAAREYASRLVRKIADGVTKSLLPLKVIVTNDRGENVVELSISSKDRNSGDNVA